MEDIRKEKISTAIFNDRTVTYAAKRQYYGSLSSADAYGASRCDCADDVRLWLNFDQDNVVCQAAYMSEGCLSSQAAGSALCTLALGKNSKQLLAITKEHLDDELGGLPLGSRHTLDLVLQALKAAVADYITVKRENWRKNYRLRF